MIQYLINQIQNDQKIFIILLKVNKNQNRENLKNKVIDIHDNNFFIQGKSNLHVEIIIIIIVIFITLIILI